MNPQITTLAHQKPTTHHRSSSPMERPHPHIPLNHTVEQNQQPSRQHERRRDPPPNPRTPTKSNFDTIPAVVDADSPHALLRSNHSIGKSQSQPPTHLENSIIRETVLLKIEVRGEGSETKKKKRRCLSWRRRRTSAIREATS